VVLTYFKKRALSADGSGPSTEGIEDVGGPSTEGIEDVGGPSSTENDRNTSSGMQNLALLKAEV